jgi:tRNA threonylcarbamoyl adenosine modification protein (Sua5/YciO/YrdC/YwlC family)
MHAKRRQIGIRIPDNKIALALLEELGHPIMSASLILPGDELPLTDPYEFRVTLEHHLDLIVDGGFCGFEPTSVIDLSEDTVKILREGCGDVSAFR